MLPEKKADLESQGTHMGVLNTPGFCRWMRLLDMVTRDTQSGTFIPNIKGDDFEPMFRTPEEAKEFDAIVSESVSEGKQ